VLIIRSTKKPDQTPQKNRINNFQKQFKKIKERDEQILPINFYENSESLIAFGWELWIIFRLAKIHSYEEQQRKKEKLQRKRARRE
jgi:hypothetical protein